MGSIIEITRGDGKDVPKGVIHLFQHSYLRTCKSWSYYRRMNFLTKIDLLSKVSQDLSSNKCFIWACDKEDKNVLYSLLCYEIIDKKLIVYFAFTKYDFRGYGFVSKLLKEVEKGTSEWIHKVPKLLGKYPKLWGKYKREPPHYPI
jgi:hypothetical protein